jgi:hypothetical protein
VLDYLPSNNVTVPRLKIAPEESHLFKTQSGKSSHHLKREHAANSVKAKLQLLEDLEDQGRAAFELYRLSQRTKYDLYGNPKYYGDSDYETEKATPASEVTDE